MPLAHERIFRVRYTECSVHDYARLAAYLRYMQEVAFDASAAAGYDLPRYKAMGCHWLIRETKLDVLRPLRYGDAVRARTWVADFRRVRSTRVYELRLANSGDLVAQGSSDWVFLDTVAQQPVTIPTEIKATFFPEGVPAMAPPRPRFPAPPAPPSGVFRQWRAVEWRDIDQAGHVNNAVYADYLEDCDQAAVAACGWPLPRFQQAGWLPLARQHRIEYQQPAFLGDELELTTWLSGRMPGGALRHYCVRRAQDGALLTYAKALWGGVDGRTGEWIQIPASFLRDFEPNATGGAVGSRCETGARTAGCDSDRDDRGWTDE